ncbi:uncharacterized protein BO95DRAFT_459010 [Aspergillus brunneoviolaceus CBS 621.78]|uniref:Uncharacterized protein n=1 Tax=Aspergillus brunneoviolaceus CBS 621.78 TaxID=1450534 RepID=A0ACD1GMP6_9EURO|nr:hypothetical protein BO95DRAFT_459010 [Aspergillus brunneoviolaceus CBS 621.78]RAH50525.1 hypothetical protein BO95DRAFT_459010 [Aspergillus brunneoviolaceus CBS 621.78]
MPDKDGPKRGGRIALLQDPFAVFPAEIILMMILALWTFEDVIQFSLTSRRLHAIVHQNIAYIFRKMAPKILGSVHLPLQLLADQEGDPRLTDLNKLNPGILMRLLYNAQTLAIRTLGYKPNPNFDRIWVLLGSIPTLMNPMIPDLTALVNYLLSQVLGVNTTHPLITSFLAQDPAQISAALTQHVATRAFQPEGYGLASRSPQTRRLVRALYRAWSLSLLGRPAAVLRYHTMTLKDLFLVSEAFAAFREPLAQLLSARVGDGPRPTDIQRVDAALSDVTFATMERFGFVHREMLRRRDAVEPGFRDVLQTQLDGLRELWKTENQDTFRAVVTQDQYWAGQGIMNPASGEGLWQEEGDDDDDE